jgi:hypothetical protein
MKLYKRGDIGIDGKVFVCYRKYKLKNGKIKKSECWSSVEKIKQRKEKNSLYYKTEQYKKRKKEYCNRPEVKIKRSRNAALYYQRPETKKRRAQYIKNKMANCPIFAVMSRVRNRIRICLKKTKLTKKEKTHELIGCSYNFLKKHIEKQFKDGMAWDKPNSFHIDHIKPLALFDLTDPEQLKEACHYTNLQPLTPIENLKKGKKLIK